MMFPGNHIVYLPYLNIVAIYVYSHEDTGGSLYNNRRRTTCSSTLCSDYICLQARVHDFVHIDISITTQMRSINTSFHTVLK